MLVLRRKIRERVFLRNKITGETIGNVMLIETRTSDGKIAFDCPPNVEILREELLDDDREDGLTGERESA